MSRAGRVEAVLGRRQRRSRVTKVNTSPTEKRVPATSYTLQGIFKSQVTDNRSSSMNVFVQMPLAYYATKEGVDEEALRALFQAPAKPQPSSYKTFGQTQSTPASAKHTRCAPAAVGATEEERIAAMAVLGIDEWPCDAQLVRTTARRAYREAHPDKGGDNASAQARFRAIYDARALLLRLLPA